MLLRRADTALASRQSSKPAQMVRPALNVASGILMSYARLQDNSHLLKPPINNYCVTNEHMTVMVRGSMLLRNQIDRRP